MESQIKLIVDERKRQDKKWGADRNLDDMEWLTILVEEVGESAEAILKGLPSIMDEVVQIAAVALAWLECLDRRRRTLRADGTSVGDRLTSNLVEDDRGLDLQSSTADTVPNSDVRSSRATLGGLVQEGELWQR